MPPRARSNPGRPFDTYILDYPPDTFFPVNVTKFSYSPDRIKSTTIPRLTGATEPSGDICSIFSEVLSLAYHPKELYTLNNTTLLSSCIRALRQYVTDNHSPRTFKLFGHEAGFLCFRTIVLLIQIGILASTDNIDRLLWNSDTSMSDPSELLRSLTELMMILLNQYKREPNARRWLLGSSISPVGRRTLLKSVGGFTDTDAEFLLRLLWQDRKRFSKLCTQVQTPGWSLLLLLIGEHMQWKSELVHTPYDQWLPLETLYFRYSLDASANEAEFIEFFCVELIRGRPDPDEDLDDKCYENSLVDTQDARAFLLDLLRRTEFTQPFPPALAALIIKFARQRATLSIVDLMPAVVGAACSRIWIMLETAAGDSKHLSADIGFNRYATQLFGLIDRLCSVYATTPTIISSIAQVLSENDFVNLFGRLVLLSLSVGSPLGELAQGSPSLFGSLDRKRAPYNVARSWFDLSFEALEAMNSCGQTGNQFQETFDSSFPDWMKLRRCLDANFPQHRVTTGSKAFENHVQGTRATLLKMAYSFGYSERAFQNRMACTYPRCPGTSSEGDVRLLVCSKCQVAPYCSHACQNKNWDWTDQPHRQICGLLATITDHTGGRM